MELIDRINGLEKEMDMVKNEIKKVLVDVREAMNMAENPFAHLDELQQGGKKGVDEARVKKLEDTIAQLQELSAGNPPVDEARIHALEASIDELKSRGDESTSFDESRITALEASIAQLKGLTDGIQPVDESRIHALEAAIDELKSRGDESTSFDESRITALEAAIQQLKMIEMSNAEDGDMFKHLENSMQELEHLGTIEVEKLQKLETAMEMLGETKTQPPSGLPAFHPGNPSESDRQRIMEGLGDECTGETWDGIIDPLMLAQLIRWADYSLNLIGIEQLNYVIDLYELTGRLPREMKDAILKIIELPTAYLTTKTDDVEAKHCVIALFELDRIITGEHQELCALLRDMY